MNLFYQRTYLVLGMFFIFVGAYSTYDAGTSFLTTTTTIVIVGGIGFVLGGIYLLVTYLKNRKILKRLDQTVIMTDFKKVAADGFEINAKTLEQNPDDAAARSYMLGVMMAKHLDEQHIRRAKRYVID